VVQSCDIHVLNLAREEDNRNISANLRTC